MIFIKRPIITILVGAIIGIMFGLYLKIGIALAIILLALLLFLIQKNKHRLYFFIAKRRKIILIIFISAIISNLYLNIVNLKYENIYKNFQKHITARATIVSEAKETEYYYSYEANIENKKFIIYVKKSYPQKLKYGMWINLEGEYSKPTEARNYKGFSYQEYLKTKRIYGTIKAEKINVIKENNINIFLNVSNNIRNKIIKITKEILPNETYSMVTGILIGEKNDIDEEITKNFSKASISHILAISGTHVSYIILGITYILIKIKTPKRGSYLITIFILAMFMVTTRFSPSVVRAVIMSVIMLFGKVIYRKQDTLNSISVSLLIILIFNPYAIMDIGLQLSYLGTLGILFLNKIITNFLNIFLSKKIATMLAVTISAQIMIFPVMIIKFNIISTMFILSNIVAVPLAGIIILLGYINIFIAYICMPLGKFIGIFLNLTVQLLISIAKYTAILPFSTITVTTPNIIFLFEYYIFIYCICVKKHIKIVIYIIISTIIVFSIINIIHKPLKIHFVDVGQGDCTVITTTSRRNIVIDTGEKENVVVKYLLDRKIKNVDFLIISHFDSDHCKNASDIIENLKVHNLIISKQAEKNREFETIIQKAKEKNVTITMVKAGDVINIDKYTNIRILWPEKSLIEENPLNNNSIVAKFEYRNFSILFTGDIEKVAENQIVSRYNYKILESTILKVAHHGSKTSSTEEFIKTVKPKISVIGVGENNKFGHPNNSVIETLKDYGSAIYRTDLQGEITLTIKKNGKIKIDTQI